VSDRLDQIVAFLERADELKRVERMTWVGDESRRENSAEHSWHAALYALVLADELEEPVDVGHTLALLVVHDLVEIGAGDTYAFDEAGKAGQREREERAADELFGALPADTGGKLRALWEEFEARETPEAQLAVAIDRMQALVQNLAVGGRVWKENAITADAVRLRNAETLAGDPSLAALIESLLERAAPHLA
jgi:putative hydrolase of HD superfamily